MRSGPLRHRITIEQATESRDSSGGVISTWGTYATVWASVSPLIGREYIAAKTVSASVTHKIRMRYLAGMTPKMRIAWDSRLFDIESILDVDERHAELVIMATEVV